MKNSYTDLRRLILSTRPSMFLLSVAGLLTIIEVAGTLWFPILTRDLIDQIGSGMPFGSTITLLAGALVLLSAAGAFSRFFLEKIGQTFVSKLRHRLTTKLIHQPVEFFTGQSSGELASRIVSDSTAISSLITTHAMSLVSGILLLTGSAIVLLYLDIKLTLILFGLVLLAFLIVVPIVIKMETISRDTQDKTAALTGILTQIFSENRLVKAFLAEDREIDRSQKHISSLYKLALRAAKIKIGLEPIMGLAVTTALISILAYGSIRVANGDLSVGTLTAFILYIFNVITPLAQLSLFVAELQTAKGASTRIAKIMDSKSEQPDVGTMAIPAGQDIRFVGTGFSYGGSDQLVLDGLDMTIKAGKTTALVGISGSGKSTILALVERFYSPQNGTVFYGETPIDEFPLGDWRNQIGFVSQNAPVMPGSIRDNICYGMKDPVSDERVREAAKAAKCLDFIENLDDGFETEIGEQGDNISGGQRQRLAIARVFLKNPAILILDEATSSLDSETEHQVQQALDAVTAGRTSIIVAHRLSTIVNADKIIVLEAGRVSGEGIHAELLKSHALYARLVKHQFAD